MSENTNPAGRYPHVVAAIRDTPWAIEHHTLQAIRQLVQLRAGGEKFTADEIAARVGTGPSRRDGQVAGGVAVLPLYGVISPRADLMTEMSGGTSIDRFTAAFRQALADDDVKAIVLDVNSPGGMTDMVPELAAEIRAARGVKPIVAVANTKAASAAYWLASQADELVVTRSGSLGSIGVFAAHEDISRHEEMEGVKTTLISAGKFKTEGNPFEPLSDDARASIQEKVDEMYQMFTTDVARGRSVPVGSVRDGFGEGRMVTARKAIDTGMADSIDTLEGTVRRLQRSARRPASEQEAAFSVSYATIPADTTNTAASFAESVINTSAQPAADIGMSFVEEAREAHDAARALIDRCASLAEVRKGRLTAAKREALSACSEALRESAQTIDGLLADTDPDKRRSDLLAAVGRFELERLQQSI